MKFKQFVSLKTDSEKSIKDKQKQALYNELKTAEDNKKKDILKKLKLKEAREKILQAKVKNIPIGTVAKDNYYSTHFTHSMTKKRGQILDVKLATDDVDGKNWYVERKDDNDDVYHKSWLEFLQQQELDI